MPVNSNDAGFLKAISHEKNERAVRASLQDVLFFQQSLDKEIRKIEQAQRSSAEFDEDLLNKMMLVKEHYGNVVAGFVKLDDNKQRHMLTIYADAVQDLIVYIHRSGA